MRLPLALFFLALGTLSTARQEPAAVYLVYEAGRPTHAYAARQLRAALAEEGHTLLDEPASYDWLLSLAEHAGRYEPEAFAIIPEDRVLTVYGGDGRGLIYGALELAQRIRQGTPFHAIEASSGRPALAFRGIKFNLTPCNGAKI